MQVLSSTHGKFYRFSSRYPSASSFVSAERFSDYYFTQQFVNRIHTSDMNWLQLAAHSKAYSSWRNSHPHANVKDYIAECLVNKKLYAFEIKQSDKGADSIAQKGFKDSDRIHYQFAMANVLLLRVLGEIKKFHQPADADDFLKKLNISQAQLQSLNIELDLVHATTISNDPSSTFKSLSHALMEKRVLIIVDRGEKRHRLTSDDFNQAMALKTALKETLKTEQPFALGPHDDGSHSYTQADNQKEQAPQSLDECETRLQKARETIIKDGYSAKYTDSQLEALADNHSVGQARFLVSFMPVNTNPEAKLGHQKNSGLVPIWATSFEMLENADTDPQIIADLLATGYDPNKEYVLHIVDRGESLKDFGENTFVPTWDKLEKPAKKHLNKRYHDAIGEVLNSDYQEKYAKHMDEYWGKGLGEFDKHDQQFYTDSLTSSEKKKFKARHNLRTEFGAHSEFTGNGMTQCRHSGNKNGVVETLTLENDPPPISQMKNVKSIRLKPIKG